MSLKLAMEVLLSFVNDIYCTYFCNRFCIIIFISVPVSVDYQVSSGQESSKNITWKAPQNKCPVIDYAVQYQLVKRVLCQEVDGEFETLHNTTERQSPLPHPDLLPNSIYMVRVLARNEAGLGEPQNEKYIEHTTPERGIKFLI